MRGVKRSVSLHLRLHIPQTHRSVERASLRTKEPLHTPLQGLEVVLLIFTNFHKAVCNYFLLRRSFSNTDLLSLKSPGDRGSCSRAPQQFIRLNTLESPVRGMSLSRMCQADARMTVDRIGASWGSISSGHGVHGAARCIFPGLDTSFVLSRVWPPLIRHAAPPVSPQHSLRPGGVNRSMASEQVEVEPQIGSNAVAAH